MRTGRVAGILFIVGGLALGLIGVAWLVANVTGGQLQVTGAVLGGGILAVVVLPLLRVGIFLLVRSGREAVEDAERDALRKILDIVKSRGQLQISELVLELGSTRRQVQDQIHALVGMGLYSGYINWEDGTLYSAEAAKLRDLDRCNHCGGDVSFAGKGVLSCPYCGTEYFLN